MDTDDYYKNMEEDAFDVAVQYTNATELIEVKEYYEKDGVVDMCKALTDLIEHAKAEEKVNTEKERQRADAAETRADAAETENRKLRQEIERLKREQE